VATLVWCNWTVNHSGASASRQFRS